MILVGFGCSHFLPTRFFEFPFYDASATKTYAGIMPLRNFLFTAVLKAFIGKELFYNLVNRLILIIR